MSKLSNSYMLGKVVNILIIFAVAKSVSLVFMWFLPGDGVDFEVKHNYRPTYQRVDFKIMLKDAKIVKAKQKSTSQSGVSITNMILKGLYGNGSEGFAIVALKSSPQKTSIVSVGEEFSGYVLKSILSNGVVFVKMGKEYILRMKSIKTTDNFIKVPDATSNSETKNVKRGDINLYMNNPKQLWRDVSISPLKEAGVLKGFRVTNIKRDSKISKLGLKVGDIIIRANNMELKSYNDVFKIYNNISKLKVVEIVVLRDDQEKEFVYEID